MNRSYENVFEEAKKAVTLSPVEHEEIKNALIEYMRTTSGDDSETGTREAVTTELKDDVAPTAASSFL